jgi:hypothetical protein
VVLTGLPALTAHGAPRRVVVEHAEHIRGRTLNATAGASNPHSPNDHVAADARHRGVGPSNRRGVVLRGLDRYRIIAVKDGARVTHQVVFPQRIKLFRSIIHRNSGDQVGLE